jgi:methylated-DNA-[protein]-cysteine S-methyltransferase
VPQLSIHTPIGDVTLFEEDGCIVALDWGWASTQEATPFLRGIASLLHGYFDGTPLPADLPLSPAGGTAYQRRVWNALRAIPSGQTLTYGELARIAGGGPRSVGAANGANPIPILIPCHRVVAASGIGGYSGGDGLPTKRFLLALEAGRQASHPSGTPMSTAID